MEEELSKWEEDVKSQRDSFYELNYYTTVQLLTLRRELGRLKDSSKSASISPEVLALLQSISSEVGDSHVISAVSEVLVEAERKPEPVSAVEMSPDSPNQVEVDGAAEVSSADGLSKDMDLPEPMEESNTEQGPVFSEDDLSGELKGYITTISSARLFCSRRLVLKAIEMLGENLTRIDYEEWCVENEDKYSFEDQEASSDDEEESESDGDSTDTSSDDEGDRFKHVPGIIWCA
jgi:hypothetical protein